MKNNHLSYLLLLTIGTLFISTSGALGKFIDMPTPVLIWWRSLFAFGFLFVYVKYKKLNFKIDLKTQGLSFFLSGVFMGGHWITYFYALKMSNVALGMLSLFTFPVIIALLEPLFVKTKFDPMHIVLAIMVLLGIYILAPEFNLENSQVKGILFGLLSALFYALRTLISKQQAKQYDGTVLMMCQVMVLTVVLLPTLFMYDSSGLQTQFPFVLMLALVTTALGHTMFLQSLKYFKVSTASIIGSTQPIFGIIIAFFFLGEIPTINTFFGGLLILATVIIESVRSKKS